MADSSPFVPAGGLATFASVGAGTDLAVDEPPADHVCAPPVEP